MLRLTFEPDSNGIGQLFAEVTLGGFSGHSSAWLGIDQIVAFAQKLADSYPLSPNAPVSLEGGYLTKSGTEVEQLHLGLKFFPIGSLGHIGCRVSLTDPFSGAHERPENQSSVVVELHTTYEPLRTFAQSLKSLVTGGLDEVVLGDQAQPPLRHGSFTAALRAAVSGRSSGTLSVMSSGRMLPSSYDELVRCHAAMAASHNVGGCIA